MKRLPLLFILFLCAKLFAQPNAGLPFITSFSPADYRQGAQNFAVLQDKQGILYFGNNNGVLIYDGVQWELLPVLNQSEVHSLAQDSAGRIYVGAQGDFGYLQRKANGTLSFVSLLHLLDSVHRNFNDVWAIYCTPSSVVFRSTKGIYVYQNDKITAIPLPTSTHRSFFVYNKVFVRQDGTGLQQLIGDSLTTVAGGEAFTREPIHSMFAYSGNRYLVASENKGFYLYDGKLFAPFNTPVNDIIKGQSIYGEAFPNGTFALGTRKNGLIIIDGSGSILYQLSKKEGVADESVWAVTTDRYSGNLWLATNNGISVVEINSPFTTFQNRSGLNGQFYQVVKHKGFLYAAGTSGVFRKKLLAENPAQSDRDFQIVATLDKQAWSFFADSTTLLAATNAGIFSIRADEVRNIGFTGRAWFFLPLTNFPGYVLANTAAGILILKKTGTTFSVYRTLQQHFEALYNFVQTNDGDVWVNSPIRGVYRLRFNKGIDHDPEFKLFTQADGLPSNFKIRPFTSKLGLFVSSEKGIYVYNKKEERFTYASALNKQLFSLQVTALKMVEEDSYNRWFGYRLQPGDKQQANIGFTVNNPQADSASSDVFARILDFAINDFESIDTANVFIGTSDGIVHYNPVKKLTAAFPVVIRQVQFTKTDSLLTLNDESDIPYQLNSLRFRCASMGFSAEQGIEYQYFLEGFDKKWSEFSTSPLKEFTNLSHGRYVFKVRARNQYYQLSDETVYLFTVLPPWYQTTWAYLLFTLLGILVIYSLTVWRYKNLSLANERLEKLVSERTLEIKQQNNDILEKNVLLENQKEEIEAQKEDIQQAQGLIEQKNQNLEYINQHLEQIVESRTEQLQGAYTNLLALKNELDTFIYRSSHDIKGPLMRLLGLCNVAKADVTDATALHYFNLLEREINVTNRMLQKLIVYQYIKNLEPVLEHVTIAKLIKEQLQQLQNLPDYNSFSIQYKNDSEMVINSNSYLLGTAIYNLIENSITYIGLSRPAIEIDFERVDDRIKIFISDNGKGIDTSITEQIFEMFFRGSELSKGAGLGLYIARESIKKLHGSLQLVSRKNWQTTFEITLPYQHILLN